MAPKVTARVSDPADGGASCGGNKSTRMSLSPVQRVTRDAAEQQSKCGTLSLTLLTWWSRAGRGLAKSFSNLPRLQKAKWDLTVIIAHSLSAQLVPGIIGPGHIGY